MVITFNFERPVVAIILNYNGIFVINEVCYACNKLIPFMIELCQDIYLLMVINITPTTYVGASNLVS